MTKEVGKMAELSELIGVTLDSIMVGDETIQLNCQDGRVYLIYHERDCCEDVHVEDICGDITDLIGSPILQAEEATSEKSDPPDHNLDPDILKYRDHWTWTFYKFATIKGAVTIRWFGESNGWYSESVDLKRIDNLPETSQ